MSWAKSRVVDTCTIPHDSEDVGGGWARQDLESVTTENLRLSFRSSFPPDGFDYSQQTHHVRSFSRSVYPGAAMAEEVDDAHCKMVRQCSRLQTTWVEVRVPDERS
jgi:hypothetical protein